MIRVLAMAADARIRPGGRRWGRAALWLALLGPFFFLSYGAANWLSAMHPNVGSIVFAWERDLPFVPWTIVPYWSIDVLYGISLFVCATQGELDMHARRLLTAQVIAVICFILFPLTFTFARPEVDGLPGLLFDSLGKFDKPYNQAPSLHIALLVILWDRFAAHASTRARWILHFWFALIGVSVLTTYQHHFIDIPTGAALGFLCLWIWPDKAPSPIMAGLTALRHGTGRIEPYDHRRSRLAIFYTAGAIAFCMLALWSGGVGLWLFWPAASLVLVAANYAAFGSSGFQKSANGRMTVAALWLLGPYIAAAWINSRLWTRREPADVPIADGVSVGRWPMRGSAACYVTIIDLCAELPGSGGSSAYRAFPLLDLITPAAEQLRDIAVAIETSRASGPLLVCCALGYGRSAAAVAAWLLITGRAADADAAIKQIQHVRPRAVFHESTHDVIAAAGSRP